MTRPTRILDHSAYNAVVTEVRGSRQPPGMRSLLLALPLLSACLVLDADATDPPGPPPPPRVDEDCPPPDPGRMMVCGRVVDLVETLRVHTPLRVSFYDATAYVLGLAGTFVYKTLA